jgi:hypothetical protein
MGLGPAHDLPSVIVIPGRESAVHILAGHRAIRPGGHPNQCPQTKDNLELGFGFALCGVANSLAVHLHIREGQVVLLMRA